MDTGEQQSEQEDSCVGECAFYFTEQILTINKIVAQCTKDVRTVFETQRGANTFFQHLSLCLQSKSNLKMRLSLSKTEAMNVLTNLHLLAESCFQSLSTLDDDLLTSTTIVWSELANRIPQGVDDLESDDDDDENADNMDITTGSKESKDMFELMTPILNHPKAVVRLVLSDALPQVSAAFLRLTENNKQLKSMMLNALAFTRLDLSSSAEHAVLHRLWRACAIEPGIFPESENDVFQGNDRVVRGSNQPMSSHRLVSTDYKSIFVVPVARVSRQKKQTNLACVIFFGVYFIRRIAWKIVHQYLCYSHKYTSISFAFKIPLNSIRIEYHSTRSNF